MKFWIVTPSYNQMEWVKICIASVADQAGEEVEVHHHVQDACSTDGTPEWLENYAQEMRRQQAEVGDRRSEVGEAEAVFPVLNGYSFSYSSEKDDGMYDAINKGWRRAPDNVDVLAHLNCDEQYLPDALKTIAGFFSQHPKADVVLADMIVVDAEGQYVCHRRSLKPYAFVSKFWCAGFTAATFHRLSVTKEMKVYFDTSWKNIGDKVWYNDLHRAGCRFAVYNRMVSLFTDTGDNMNWTEQGRQEGLRYMDQFIPFMRGNFVLLKRLSRLNAVRRVIKNRFCSSPKEYFLYVRAHRERICKKVSTPSSKWTKQAWN